MKKGLVILILMVGMTVTAQDVNVLMKEAVNFERALKIDEAAEKYQAVVKLEPGNVKALVKLSELYASKGSLLKDKAQQRQMYEKALQYAEAAIAADNKSADAYYARAMVAGKMTDVEDENKKMIQHVKDIKTYADKALELDPNHGKGNYVLGKWYFEIASLNWAKRAALKLLFGGMPDATIEDAIKYMEKGRKLEPYFVANYLDLAKAYRYDNKPMKAIEVLNMLVKLPTRTVHDVAFKAEGRKLLNELQ